MFFRMLLSAIVFSFGIQAAAYAEWKYQKVQLFNEHDERDVLTVSVDYEVKTQPGTGTPVPTFTATPVHINAWNTKAAVSGQGVFRSMSFNNYGISLDSIFSGNYDTFLSVLFTEVLDLKVEGNHLFGSLSQPILLSEDACYKCIYRGVQEIAIVIDGVWYKGRNGRDGRFYLPARD